MPKMHWKLTLAILVALLVSFFIWRAFHHSPEIGDAHATKDSGAAAVAGSASVSSRTSSAQGDSSMDAARSGRELLERYTCRTTRCPGASFARDVAEAAWLRDSGYPTAAQLSAYQSMSLSALEQEASQSAAMRALYSERLSEQGRQIDAAEQARRSIAQGSLYGLYELSRIYGKQGLLYDKVSSLAALRLAYIMGDEKALDSLYSKADGMSVAEMQLIDTQAMTMYRRILVDRARLVGYGIRVSPRPR